MRRKSRYRALLDGSAHPWELERTWKGGRIAPIPGQVFAGIVFGLVWLLLVVGMTFAVVRDGGGYIGYLALVMLAPGIHFLYRSLRRFFVNRRYPDVHLQPSSMPVAPGDPLECVLHSGADAARFSASDVTFNVRVSANKWVLRSSNSDRRGPRKQRYVLWETRIPVAAVSGVSGTGSGLIGRFAVDLPGEYEETSRLPGTVTYDWRLDVNADGSLPGYQYEFRLPVFDTRTALERANDALGTETESAPDDRNDDDPAIEPAMVPVQKGDLEGLRAYRGAVHADRLSSDGRGTAGRLLRGLAPHTIMVRSGDEAAVLLHVKGDHVIRRIRRLLAACLVLSPFFVPGMPVPLVLFGGGVFFAMGRAAKPAAIAVHADRTGVQIDEARGRKDRSRHYSWHEVGMISHTRHSSVYFDVMIRRPDKRTPTIGARIPSRREAEGAAAAIASVKDRYQS